jgi:hypothetical protein
MKTDQAFANLVYDIIDEEVIQKFNDKTGDASSFYTLEGEEEPEASKLGDSK